MGKGVVFLIGGERCISLLTAGGQPDVKLEPFKTGIVSLILDVLILQLADYSASGMKN